MAAPKYLSEQDYYQRMTDFTGYIGHVNNQTKSELRNEIILSEDRIKTELRAEIAASEARMMQKFDAVNADVATLKSDVATLKEGQEKLTKDVSELRTHVLDIHKMMQLVLDQMSAMRAEMRRS